MISYCTYKSSKYVQHTNFGLTKEMNLAIIIEFVENKEY